MITSNHVKIQVYCPEDSADKIRMAIGESGGGQIGNYTHCAFVSKGQGYFLPLDGSNPTIGEIGKIAKVKEVKIEFICENGKINKVIDAIKKAHPYEEPAIDIIPILNFIY